jgi:hypothetical protein
LAKKRTEKSKYKSPSSGDYCTASQWLAETMCIRMAERTNEGSLCHKFWNTEKWKKTYGWQVICANRLMKQFGEEIVIPFIRENGWILSLGIKTLPGKIKKYAPRAMKKIEADKEAIKRTEKVEEPKTDGTNIERKKKSIASRLK